MPSINDCIQRNVQLKDRKAAKAEAELAKSGPSVASGNLEPRDFVHLSFWFETIPGSGTHVMLKAVIDALALDAIVADEDHRGIVLTRDDLMPAFRDLLERIL